MQIGPFSLYDYQLRGLELSRQAVARMGRPARLVVVAPTGAGKTVVALALMRLAVEKGSRVGFITSGRQLILQMARTMERAGLPFSVLMAQCEYQHNPEAPVQLVSKDTLQARPHAMGEPPVIWVVDEADVCMSAKWQEILSTADVVIGFTATPTRGPGKGMGPYYQEMVEVASYSELLSKNRLVPVQCRAPSKPDLRRVSIDSKTKDYHQGQLGTTMNQAPLIGDVFRWWDEITHRERPTFVFTVDVAHAVHVAEVFNGHGVRAEWISGETDQDERDEIFAGLESGDIKVVASCGVLTRGVDVPCVSCGVLAKPTRSLRQYLQMVGRILRTHPSKSDAILIDHAGAIEEHLWPTMDRDWELMASDSLKEAKPKKEGEKSLRTCPKCGWIWEHHESKLCPNCSYQRTVRGVQTLMEDGTYQVLKEEDYGRKKSNKSEGQKQWLACLGIAARRGMTVAAARGMFHTKHGHWPDQYGPQPEPSEKHRKVAAVWPGFAGRGKKKA